MATGCNPIKTATLPVFYPLNNPELTLKESSKFLSRIFFPHGKLPMGAGLIESSRRKLDFYHYLRNRNFQARYQEEE